MRIRTTSRKRNALLGLTAAGVALGAILIPAAAANAYSNAYRYGYADCSYAGTHPSLQSEESGAIETVISPGEGYYTFTANSGSTVALHASTLGENEADYGDLYTNAGPLEKSWGCRNIAPGNY